MSWATSTTYLDPPKPKPATQQQQQPRDGKLVAAVFFDHPSSQPKPTSAVQPTMLGELTRQQVVALFFDHPASQPKPAEERK